MESGVLWAQVPTGFYMSAWKALPVVLVLLAWARLMAWLDKDSERAHLPRAAINLAVLGAGILAFALFFFLAVGFWVALVVLLVINLAAFGVYLGFRQQKVGLSDLQTDFANWIRGFGGKPAEVKAPPGDVLLLDKASNPVPAPDDEDPGRPAYDAVQQMLTLPLRRGAQRIEVSPGEGAVHVEYYVDGVAYNGLSLNRSASAGAIALLKALAGMDVKDRRKPQSGTMKLSLDGKRRELRLETRGGVSGESLSVQSDFKTRHSLRLEQLGLPDKQLATIQESIRDGGGIVLVAAPLQQGLTSMLYAIVRAHDAFLSHIITVEREPDTDLEGVTQDKLPRNVSGADEAKRVAWITSQQPDVLMISEVNDGESAKLLSGFADDGHRVYIGLRAATSFDAITQWRKLMGDDRRASEKLRMVICGRVVRKLCNACKVGYAPDPQTLRKMNMDPDVVGKLYQARTEPLRDPKGNPIPCTFCNDLRFSGRTGIYEILLTDDPIRQVIAAGGSINQLKSAFRQQRGRYLQEQALALVEKGETSIQEVLRVLKGDGSGSAHNPKAAPRNPTSST